MYGWLAVPCWVLQQCLNVAYKPIICALSRRNPRIELVRGCIARLGCCGHLSKSHSCYGAFRQPLQHARTGQRHAAVPVRLDVDLCIIAAHEVIKVHAQCTLLHGCRPRCQCPGVTIDASSGVDIADVAYVQELTGRQTYDKKPETAAQISILAETPIDAIFAIQSQIYVSTAICK
jgi:hypothetical protein